MDFTIEEREEIADVEPVIRELMKRAEPEHRHILLATDWFDDEEIGEGPALWQEFLSDYKALVAKISSVIRPADFNGSWTDKGYPDEFEWVAHLAYWMLEDRVLYLVCDQQDNGTPMILALGISPRSMIETRPKKKPARS